MTGECFGKRVQCTDSNREFTNENNCMTLFSLENATSYLISIRIHRFGTIFECYFPDKSTTTKLFILKTNSKKTWTISFIFFFYQHNNNGFFRTFLSLKYMIIHFAHITFVKFSLNQYEIKRLQNNPKINFFPKKKRRNVRHILCHFRKFACHTPCHRSFHHCALTDRHSKR